MRFIIYYMLLAMMTIVYSKFRRKKILSISDVVLFLTWILVASPGPFCAYGYALLKFQEFDRVIYWNYILYFVFVTIGFSFGAKVKVRVKAIAKLDFEPSDMAIWFIYIVIFIYSLMFFWIIRDNIPIINLLFKDASAIESRISRLSVTHNITDTYELPFLFRYVKLIINTPMFLLTNISFLKFLQNKRRYKGMFLVILATTVFYQTYALEKSGVVYIIMMLTFSYLLYVCKLDKKMLKVLLGIGGGVGLCVFGMYWLFMGQHDVFQIIQSVFTRLIIRQTGYIYYQNDILESLYNGCLRGKGVSIFLIDSVLNREVVSLSKEAYRVIYNVYSKAGYVGTTGGMTMFYFYSNFGFFVGSIIFGTLCLLTGIIDGVFRNNIKKCENKTLILSVYSTLMILLFQGFLGNLSTVYMLPFGISPQIILLIMLTIFIKLMSVGSL